MLLMFYFVFLEIKISSLLHAAAFTGFRFVEQFTLYCFQAIHFASKVRSESFHYPKFIFLTSRLLSGMLVFANLTFILIILFFKAESHFIALISKVPLLSFTDGTTITKLQLKVFGFQNL
jgi:hypothetical protein